MSTNPETEELNPRQHFATALRAMLERASINPPDYAEFGQEVATAQHRAYTGGEVDDLGDEEVAAQAPARHIPYGAHTVSGWVSGALLPTHAALQAICTTLKNEYGAENHYLQALDDFFENAVDWQATQPCQPTELTHAMKVGRKQAGLSYEILADKNILSGQEKYARRWNGRLSSSEGEISQSGPGLLFAMNGHKKNRPSKYLTHAMRGWTEPLTPSLHALHEQTLRERADILWQAAERESDDLGGMLKAIRIRYGASLENFGKRIALLAGREELFKSSILYGWETNNHLPTGDLHHSDTVCESYILAAKIADAAPNGFSRSIETPWFTSEMERSFRDTFRRRVEKTNESHLTFEMPAYKLSGPPDMRAIPPALKIIDGGLTDKLINGNSTHQR